MVDTDDTRCTTDDERRTTLLVWHKLPTGELKKEIKKKNSWGTMDMTQGTMDRTQGHNGHVYI